MILVFMDLIYRSDRVAGGEFNFSVDIDATRKYAPGDVSWMELWRNICNFIFRVEIKAKDTKARRYKA